MRRHLFGANSFKQSFHVVEMREHNWIFVTVIWMNVSLLHVFDVLLVITLSIFSLVYSFLSIMKDDIARMSYVFAGPACLAAILVWKAVSNLDLTLKATDAK
jgi:hypothetical protein